MYLNELTDNDKLDLKSRREKIIELQNKGICFGCYNFQNGDIFPDE